MKRSPEPGEGDIDARRRADINTKKEEGMIMKKLKLLMLSFALTCLMGMTVSAAEVDEYGYTRVEYVDYTYGSGWVRQFTNIQTERGEKIAYFDLGEGHERGKSYMEDSVDTEGANVYHVDMQAIIDYDDTPEETLIEPMLIKINISEITEDSKVEGWAGGRPSQTSVKAMNISSQRDGYVIFAYEGPIIDDCYICITVRGTNTETNTEANKDSSKDSGKSKSSKKSSGSGSSAVEEVRFTTALSPAAEVNLASGAADLQIGPPTRTFYESDGQALLGTTEPVSVYLADFWLVDRATGAVVTPGADGAVVTINIPGVTASSKVMIRQWPYGTDEYVDFAPVEVGNGYIKVKFTTMSQAAICVAGADAAVTADTAAAVTTEKMSPKTSDSMLIYAAEAIALVSILGFVICRKKSV